MKPSQKILVTCLVSTEEGKNLNFITEFFMHHKVIHACLPHAFKVGLVDSVLKVQELFLKLDN